MAPLSVAKSRSDVPLRHTMRLLTPAVIVACQRTTTRADAAGGREEVFEDAAPLGCRAAGFQIAPNRGQAPERSSAPSVWAAGGVIRRRKLDITGQPRLDGDCAPASASALRGNNQSALYQRSAATPSHLVLSGPARKAVPSAPAISRSCELEGFRTAGTGRCLVSILQ